MMIEIKFKSEKVPKEMFVNVSFESFKDIVKNNPDYLINWIEEIQKNFDYDLSDINKINNSSPFHPPAF